MIAFKHLAPVLALGLILSGLTAWAQTGTFSPRNRDRVGRVFTPDKTSGSLDAPSVATRPVRPEQNPLPPEFDRRIQVFREQARRYIAEQEALRKQLAGATTDAERDRIRALLQQRRNDWLERARAVREEVKVRQEELRGRLRGHGELFDDVKDAARDTVRGGTGRPRD
jgi:hypothetical protein